MNPKGHHIIDFFGSLASGFHHDDVINTCPKYFEPSFRWRQFKAFTIQ